MSRKIWPTIGVAKRSAIAAAGLLLAVTPASSSSLDPPAWSRPTAPFHIAGPVWYVGSEGIAAYLIRTRDGAILIDGTLPENAPMIERNIASLGVKLRDVKLLLATHAHFDHVGALARLKADSGAKLVAGAADRAALESGHPAGENLSGGVDFPAVKVDRAVRDGERVMLGGITLTARATPGHTPGCTSWTMHIVDQGRPHDIAFLCSLTVAGNRLVGNRAYPGIVRDYRLGFARVAAIRADIVLPGHAETTDMMGRAKRAAAGARDAFVTPGLLRDLVINARKAFDIELRRQMSTAR